ncbi:MAG TPA: mechanosensitive ion channel domain-containing protein [Syntrophales bacterium]|nr:mechanosensitive ion channel domain-containing protein [Syntrophales bacterium]
MTETISWYRGTIVEQQIANEPIDITFLNENRQISGGIVKLAFDFARLAARNESMQPKENQAQEQASAPSQNQRLIQAMAKADQQVEQSKNELESLRQKMATTPGRLRPALESLIGETQSELAFRQARREALREILQFSAGTSSEGADLRTRIEELARSVPAAQSGADVASPEQQKTEQTIASMPPSGTRQQALGIWGLVADLFRLSSKESALGHQIQSTDHLMQAARQLRGPLAANLRNLIQSGDQLAAQAPSGDPAAVAQQKKQLNALTARFKETSSELLPLRKQVILLNLYNTTLTNWRDAVRREIRDVLTSFLVRLGLLALIIAAVFAVGAVWRRAIFRYVQETRRRYQFLLFRKIAIWIVVGSIVALTFVTELGSVATFVGLLTAGVAVAMQNIILSVAGYFFLIGKYGIRVGDRVQIDGVIGEVVDIGIVRFHLLELGSGGMDAQPSGRVVAFSNSVVFQPTAGVFKQIPGTSFAWHEVSLTFSPEGNYRLIQERITTAVDGALKDYREEMERQMRQMERTLDSISSIELRPRTHLHIAASGIEVTVRYPVGLQNAAEIDDRVVREIYAAIDRDPKLKLVESGMPALQTEPSSPRAA